MPEGVSVGRHTYGVKRSSFHGPRRYCDVSVGAFCSIAPEVLFMPAADHDMTTIANYPMGPRLFDCMGACEYMTGKGPIVIGNDVWIGRRAIVLSGVTVGDGAIIGAGAVVSRDVPPFAVAAGNPARVVRYRFTDEEIEMLLDLAWWHWPEDRIREEADLFLGRSSAFLDAYGHLKVDIARRRARG